MFSFLLGRYLGVELLGHMLILPESIFPHDHLTFSLTTKNLSTWVPNFFFSPDVVNIWLTLTNNLKPEKGRILSVYMFCVGKAVGM